MNQLKNVFLTALLSMAILWPTTACSVLFFVDSKTGTVYAVNNEDYWYDVDAYIQIEPNTRNKYARLWYGWDNFAQGGINDKGLFFDAAVTPEQERIKGYGNPRNNLGDKILAQCATVEEAIAFLEKEKIALNQSHIMFGDRSGNAVIVEWVKGEKQLHWIQNGRLIMTNYLLSNPQAGNYPCPRYNSIDARLTTLEQGEGDIDLLAVGNTVGQAVQPAREWQPGRTGGTVYTSFINITENTFVLSYKLSNKNVVKLDLSEAFEATKKRTIKLED